MVIYDPTWWLSVICFAVSDLAFFYLGYWLRGRELSDRHR